MSAPFKDPNILDENLIPSKQVGAISHRLRLAADSSRRELFQRLDSPRVPASQAAFERLRRGRLSRRMRRVLLLLGAGRCS